MSIRVVVVDDQALVRAGFALVLRHHEGIEVVGEAANGREALRVVQESEPDVVLMDIRMPEMDGLEATSRILDQANPSVKVVILTTFDPDEYVYRALRAGASGFLLKDIPPEELVVAVRNVAAGGALLAPSVTRRLIGRFTRGLSNEGRQTSILQRLTAREREVLKVIASGRNNTEIAAKLVIGAATVKTHVSNILSKLEVRDRAQAVIFAYESGLVTPGDNELNR